MNLFPPLACSYVEIFLFRFEAHMEVHVGSIDEEDDEQGIAHMIEHVAFLGSKKREKLLGTGARSNAYTDFHHTVFHIHSPTSTKVSSLRYLSSYRAYYYYGTLNTDLVAHFFSFLCIQAQDMLYLYIFSLI